MRFLAALPPLAVLLACNNGGEEAPGFCGTSFCLSAIETNSVSQSSPIEDYTLYDVNYRSRRFRIYEGGSPRRPGTFVRSLHTQLPSSNAGLFRKTGQIEIYVERRTIPGPVPLDGPIPPPQYLHIFTSCPPHQECEIERFAALLTPRLDHQ